VVGIRNQRQGRDKKRNRRRFKLVRKVWKCGGREVGREGSERQRPSGQGKREDTKMNAEKKGIDHVDEKRKRGSRLKSPLTEQRIAARR